MRLLFEFFFGVLFIYSLLPKEWFTDWLIDLPRCDVRWTTSSSPTPTTTTRRCTGPARPAAPWLSGLLPSSCTLRCSTRYCSYFFLSHFEKKTNLWFPGFFIVAFLALVALCGLWLVFVRIRTSKCYTTNGGHQYENDQSLTYTIKSQMAKIIIG